VTAGGAAGRAGDAAQFASPALEGGNLISKVHMLGGRVFTQILKRHGVTDLNPAQGRIVYELWKQDNISQRQLSERTRLDKSTLTLMLDRLEQQGQLVRVADAADGRRRIIRLTEKNRAAHAAYLAASHEMLEIFYAGLPPEEVEAFERTLRHVMANLDEACVP
jgi:DNA-binding MarR family transcriptional regulator